MATEKRIKIVVDSKGAKRNVDDLDDSMRGLGRQADTTSNTLRTLSKVATAVISAVAVQRVVAYADRFSELQTQIKLVTDSTQALNRTTQTLLELSNSTASSLDGTVGIYTKLTRATEQLGASEEQILDVTRAINQSFVISGASAEEAANAVRQLNQGLASGVLRGEEFNAINENADRLARALAESLGVTRGELRELAAQGRLTTETVFNALQGQASAIDSEFQQVDLTVSRAFGNLNDSATVAIGRFDQAAGASNSLAKAIDSLADSINGINPQRFEQLGEAASQAGDLIVLFTELTSPINKGREAAESFVGVLEDIGLVGTPQVDALNSQLEETVRLYGQLSQVTGLTSPVAPRVDQPSGAAASTGVLNSDRGANPFATIGQTQSGQSQGERALSQLRLEAAAEEARAREELQRQNQQRLSEQFVESEQQRTERLQNELSRRLEVQRAYEETRFSDDASFFERRLAQTEFRKEEEIARLEEERANERAEQEARRQRIVENEQLTAEARQTALAEIREQELTQQKIFEEQKTRIEQDAADARTEIKKAEEQAKLEATLGAASSIIGAIGEIGKNSVKVQKAVALAQAGISIATGIARAQELPFPANIAEAARVAAVGVKAANTIKSTEIGGGGGNPQSIAGSSGSQSTAPVAQAQEPPQQSFAFEIKGFSEISRRLADFDPSAPIPAEIAQRIVDGIENIRTLEGGTA